MCGIVALFSRRAPIDASTVERATRSLYHRGPDGQRHWISPDLRVAFGHARLSIIDLVTGDQPIASEDNCTHIIVNGEFYDYERIRRDLESAGHHLRTRSDSEIALHLYEDLGTECLHHLRGEFALVLWDQRNRTLFAARDRFGIKPLFYAFHNDTLYLASEVKALFAAGVPARWDETSMSHAVEMGSYQRRTLYDGIFQVPPGHYLLATDQHIQLNQYWDFNYPRANEIPARSDADYAAEFRHVLEEAVRLRLRADVPVGCYLSGGLDSCSVLGLAATDGGERAPEPPARRAPAYAPGGNALSDSKTQDRLVERRTKAFGRADTESKSAARWHFDFCYSTRQDRSRAVRFCFAPCLARASRKAAQLGYLLWRSIPLVALSWVCSKLQQASNRFHEIASRSLMESRCARYTPCRDVGAACNELLKNRFIVSAACQHHDREARVVNSACRCASLKQQRYNLLRFAPRLCHVNRPV